MLFTLAHIAPHFSISLAVISNEGTLQTMILSIHCFGASRILSDKIWLSHYPFKLQPHKMVKHTQTIRLQWPTNCLSEFDH